MPTLDSTAAGPSLAISQLLALQIIRRSLAGEAEGIGWREAGGALRRAHAEMLRRQSAGLTVGEEGSMVLMRHEKRLLRAVAAAQVPDPALVDNLIFALAPGRDSRPFLTDAVARLAAGLTRHGHRLPAALSSPAAAPC